MTGEGASCPYCERELVTIHDDGTWEIAGNASASLGAEYDLETVEDGDVVYGFVTDAICLEHACHVKRMIKDAAR